MNESGFYSIFNQDYDIEQEPRLVDREMRSDDSFEGTLRPKSFEHFYGQQKIKENLQIFIKAAKSRNEALDHVLLYGPPGLGKTTLAGIIAQNMDSNIRITSGPAIERQGDLVALLTNLQEHDVLFIDEIHRLNYQVEEILYPAMEDYIVDIIIGKGPSARSIRLDLPHFTLIGATTRAGLLSAPLRDRFGMVHRLELYEPEEIAQIVKHNAELLNVEIDTQGLTMLSTRCRGTPRIAIRLLRRMRDFAQVKGQGLIDSDIVEVGLKALEIDAQGLDNTDRNLLSVMAKSFRGGPVGLDTLAAMTGEDPKTIEDVCEPYLMQLGFIAKTPRGRILMEQGWRHLNLTPPTDIFSTNAAENMTDKNNNECKTESKIEKNLNGTEATEYTQLGFDQLNLDIDKGNTINDA
ncbi:MAG: Holliday junction branch migration DNA helicase RuvB [Clostridiaceae bacterium]|nr:Holliday junction branch migration DNA helicase RuvB [Clostridiaceae bacterium]